MPQLTRKQKTYLHNYRGSQSAEELAKHLNVEEDSIRKYLNSAAAPPTQKKERFFKLFAVALPLLFFILLEISLRVFNYGPNLDIFSTFLNDSKYWVTNAEVGRRYFFVKQVAPATSYDALLKIKPQNGYRIFVLGGSSAAGYPYYNNAAFSRMLKARLDDFFPDRHIEILNLAMPAINSYSLLDFADELAEYEPDAFLIYAGHNEFYGALGIGSTEALGQFRGFVNLYLKLQHVRVFYLMRSFLGWIKSNFGDVPETNPAKNATLMERMVASQRIEYGSTQYRKAREIFKANLDDIFKIAQQNGVRVLISELVSNVRDQEPFQSVFRDDLDKEQWQVFFDRGVLRQKQGDFHQALEAYREAAKLDSGVAILTYQMARCLESLEATEQAKELYYKAKDQDALRFRASEDFNVAIREVASMASVPVLAMRSYFEADSPAGLIGGNLMLEHLHANLQGNFLMAESFAAGMREHGFIADKWDASLARSDEEYRQAIDVTDLDLEVANIRVQILTSGWPFEHESKFDFRKSYRPKNRMQEIAKAIIVDKSPWEEGHVQLAQYYATQGELDRAALEYRALIRGTPYNISPYLRLGLIYLEQDKFSEAQAVFMSSLAVEESAIANKWIGSIYANRRQPGKAIKYLQKSLRMNSQDAEALFNTSVSFAILGDTEQARQYCQTLMKLDPQHDGVQNLWTKLNAN